MSKKAFSSYSPATELGGLNQHQLIVDLSNAHLSCLVVNEDLKIVAFELFKLYEDELDFDDIIVDIMKESRLLDKSYTDTKVFINSAEAVLIPGKHFNKQVAEDFLTIGFGEPHKQVMRYNEFHHDTEDITVAFRLQEQVPDQINRRLIMVEFHHVYIKMAEHLLKKDISVGDIIKVQFYYKHIIVGVRKQGKLQLVQYFDYQTAEDVLYHLLHICQEFDLQTNKVMLEISGIVDLQSALYTTLEKYFDQIGLEEINQQQLSPDFQQYPSHYLAPFFNLAV